MQKIIYFFICLLISSVSKAHDFTLEDVIENVNSSVVSINVKTDETEALGAGIIIDTSGYIVTNAHVTEKAKKIVVITVDDEYYEAELIGSDDKTDIALLKISGNIDVKAVEFGDSELIRVGSPVFAIGNPFGLGNSVSLGIISAKERDIEKGPYDNFIQTDASINQGNSGGPLFNKHGEVIGINTAIFSTDGKNTGVAFATPSNIVKWVVDQIKQNGKVIRGWLGISVKKVSNKKMQQGTSLAVSSMVENSPASKTGIKVGDVIEAFGEISLDNPRKFSLDISKIAPETTVPVTISRDGSVFDLQIKIAEMPSDDTNNPNTENNIKSFSDLGIDKYSIKKAKYFPEIGLKAYYDTVEQEFVVVEVVTASEAYNKGIKVGNRFSEIDDKKVFSEEDLRIKIKEASENKKIKISLRDEKDILAFTVYLNLESQND